MGFSRMFRSIKKQEILQEKSLTINVAMAHIREHGSLDGFLGSRNQSAIMQYAIQNGLIRWNKTRQGYDLTKHGHEVATCDCSMDIVLFREAEARSERIFRRRVRISKVIGAFAGMAAGLGLIAWFSLPLNVESKWGSVKSRVPPIIIQRSSTPQWQPEARMERHPVSRADDMKPDDDLDRKLKICRGC
jgi:hypothetical protein